MNSRQVSLPDLVTERRRNTAMSLSEGFPGFERKPALEATQNGWLPYNGSEENSGAKCALAKILPVYYRTRQFVLSMEKDGCRIPKKLGKELQEQEQAVGMYVRELHPLFFQRFDELQLDRMLRAMPFLRLSQGRWIFGGEGDQAWTEVCGEAVFIILSGRVALFPEPAGKGEKEVIYAGSIFGEDKFRLGDEGMKSHDASSAKCEEPCMCGMLTAQVLETAFADRAFGNKRIAQIVKNVPSLHRITQPDKKNKTAAQRAADEEAKKREMESTDRHAKAAERKKEEEKSFSGSVLNGLADLSKVSTGVNVSSGQPVLSAEHIDESFLIVSKGGLEVRSDVTLTERLESLPPKKVRINVTLERAENLAGDSIFDKLDPYCKVKMGDWKTFQTPVMWNVGPNPKFDYEGVLTYSGEPELEFTVMDHDKFSADDLCGHGVLNVTDIPHGWHGKVQLTRPKRGIYKSDSTHEEEAGKILITIKYDFEPITASTRKPKARVFPDQTIFELKDRDCWGHEQLMMGALFRTSLEQASHGMKYALTLGEFKVVGATGKGVKEICTAWKVTRARFDDFVNQCARRKQFMQACRVSSLEKQNKIKDLIKRLIKKWETEEASKFLRGGVVEEAAEEVMDPSRFRITYRDTKARVTVRNALNLAGGGMFDKLDPYAIVRFRGSKQPPFRTSILEDAGADPFWASEGCRHKGALMYNGETALEISVWDYDKYSNDDLIAQGVIQVDQFCRGFEGSVPLNLPDGKKRKANQKQMMIVLGIQWDPPKDPMAGRSQDMSKSATIRSAMAQLANQTH